MPSYFHLISSQFSRDHEATSRSSASFYWFRFAVHSSLLANPLIPERIAAAMRELHHRRNSGRATSAKSGGAGGVQPRRAGWSRRASRQTPFCALRRCSRVDRDRRTCLKKAQVNWCELLATGDSHLRRAGKRWRMTCRRLRKVEKTDAHMG